MKEINLKKACDLRRKDGASAVYGDTLDKLTAVLDEVQARCSARTIEAKEVVKVLCGIEKTLGISKASMNGVTVDVDIHAQQFPSAYKWIPESTKFSALYKNGAWRVTDVRRYTTSSPSKAILIHHTEASLQALRERFTAMPIITVI